MSAMPFIKLWLDISNLLSTPKKPCRESGRAFSVLSTFKRITSEASNPHVKCLSPFIPSPKSYPLYRSLYYVDIYAIDEHYYTLINILAGGFEF
jgi:hypothetical protein